MMSVSIKVEENYGYYIILSNKCAVLYIMELSHIRLLLKQAVILHILLSNQTLWRLIAVLIERAILSLVLILDFLNEIIGTMDSDAGIQIT